jgi:predicted TIM-barrel fold metal-dependent hydrolase
MGDAAVALVDAHLHLWDPSARHHDWLEQQPPLRRRFGPGDVDPGRFELVGAVFVQADCREDEALDEVHWVQNVARPLVRGIVAYAPVHRGAAVEPQLAALAEEPLVVGVRRLLQGGPIAAIVDPQLAAGVQLLAALNLTFDLCVTHDQLPAVAELVEACPATLFVLDHVGKPPVAAGRLDPWRGDITRLASFPNVTCKLSGLATEAAPGWSSADVRPYLEHAIDAFGPRRCMVGSDWPLLTLAGTMERWFDAVLEVVGPLPAADRHAVLRGTALSVYGIDE